MGDFERALSRAEADALNLQKAAEAVVKASKRLVAAAKTGDVVALEKALEETRQSATAVSVQQRNTHDEWSVASPVHPASFLEELKEAAQALGVHLYEQDNRLFSYPVLLSIGGGSNTSDLTVKIDKKLTRTIRPSFLAAMLKALGTKEPKFKPADFLKSLLAAYEVEAKRPGEMVELVKLYALLTLFPGQSREYGRQEFARDLYLLDQSATKQTGNHTFRFSASTGTKGSASKLFPLVDRDGHERVYYAISFEPIS